MIEEPTTFGSIGKDLLSQSARLYCAVVIALGVAFVAAGATTFEAADRLRLAGWIFSSMLIAPLKLRVPGATATVSGASVAILSAIGSLTFGEAVLIAVISAVVQSYIGALYRPRAIQVAFSAAALAISAGCAYIAWHGLSWLLHSGDIVPRLIVTAATYFILNTVLVTGILTMTSEETFVKIWDRLYLWTFPHYLASACLGGLLSYATASLTDGAVLLILPAVCLFFSWAVLLAQRLTASTDAISS